MNTVWKPLAITSTALAAVLFGAICGATLWSNSAATLLQRNVRDQIRFHLEHGETERAAAVLDNSRTYLNDAAIENALRLEIARAGSPALGSRMLDGLVLPAMDPAQAALAAQTRVGILEKLFEGIVLVDGAFPAPFEPLPFRTTKEAAPSIDSRREICAKLLRAIGERRDLARRAGEAPDPALTSLEAMLSAVRYAFGEIPFEAVPIADDEGRFRFGDLLYRERQFDRALAVWTPILNDRRVARRIVELSALRRFAPKNLALWDFDLERLPKRDPELEADASRAVEASFKASIPGRLASGPPEPESAVFDPEARLKDSGELAAALDPQQLYLLVEHRGFEFQAGLDRPFLTKAAPEIALSTSYGGPIRFRLFKAPSLRALEEYRAETLAARRDELESIRSWEETFDPLGLPRPHLESRRVTLPALPAGLYVLMADARYCPVFAFTRFVVSDVALVQIPSLDRVLVYAVDRLSGAPVPALPLEGVVRGQRVLTTADLHPTDDSVADEYRRGFEAGWSRRPVELQATPSYERGHAKALALRADNPDLELAFQGSSDAQGIFEWPVAPAWRETYQYTLRTSSASTSIPTHVESSYAGGSGVRELRVVAYPDRPLYHPGELVSFKAILRERDPEGLKAYDGAEAFVEIGSGSRSILSRAFPVSGFGTLHGSLELPEDCATGEWWMRINNVFVARPFSVADYRKADGEIVVTMPSQVRAGQDVAVSILARRLSGEPIARTKLRLSLRRAPSEEPSPPEDETFPAPVARTWQDLEQREFETNEEGRVSYSFRSDPGASQRYEVQASILHEFQRELLGDATIATVSRIRVPQIETERPSYHPGETARVRFRIPEATLVRIEERGGGEKRFLLNVPLVEGVGSAEIPLTESMGTLSIGVRDGEIWSWSRLPLRVLPRVSTQELVAIRLDRAIYRPGETARVEISSTEPDASVLFLVATGRIRRYQQLRLANRKAEIELPILDEDVPNVHLVALSVKNDRVGKATLELRVPPVDRFLTLEVTTDQKEYRPGQDCQVSVRVLDRQGRPVPDCEISLGVVDDAVYALRSDQTPDLREYFHRYSRPLRVSESYFYKQSLPPFEIWKCPVFVRGTAGLYETLGIGKGGGGGGRYGGRMGGRENLVARGGGSRATIGSRIREDFRDSAFWNAQLVSGPDGRASASFRFPDSLTRFRFTARGITRAHQVGEIRQETIVRKPFFVTLGTPRLLQEGDEIVLAGAVHNHTAQTQTLKAAFTLPFPAETPAGVLTLLPGASGKLETRMSVDRFLPEAELEFAAETASGERDALRLRLPGARRGSPHSEGRSGSVAGGTPREEVFRIPGGVLDGTLRLTIDVDAGIHGAILGALDPLLDYPYGCVEQTMSRFLPAVAARRALGELPPRFKDRLPAVIAKGLERLYTLQQDDGSWGWWAGRQRNPALSAYVLYGLALCKKAGVGVDRHAAERAAKSILQGLETTREDRLPVRLGSDPRLFDLLALAEYESAWNLKSAELQRRISTWTDRSGSPEPVDALLLALAALRRGMPHEATQLAPIAERCVPENVAQASLLLQFQAARGGDLAPSVRFLLSRRSGRGWGNTIESAFAILGLASAIERPNPALEAAPGRVQVSVNGAPVQDFVLKSGADASFDGRLAIPAPPGGWGEKAVVRFDFDGTGSAFYTASLDAMLADAGKPAVIRGYRIVREYYEQREDGWLPVDGPISPGRLVLVLLTIASEPGSPRSYLMVTDPRPAGFEPVDLETPLGNLPFRVVDGLSDAVDLRAGWDARLAEFRSSVRGDAARETAWGRALLREILLKKRFEPVTREEKVDLSALIQAERVEQRHDRALFFLSENVGRFQVAYLVRAELAGRVHALPPRVEAMYIPERRGSGIETSLEVGAARAQTRSTLELPPGVAGLLDVLSHLQTIDPDELIGSIPSRPRIGTLLEPLCDGDAMRAWLTTTTASAAAGPTLTERIRAARQDLATRRLGAEALGRPDVSRSGVILSALEDEGLSRRILEGVDPGKLVDADSLLAWADEEQRLRMQLLESFQSQYRTARLLELPARKPGFLRVLAALGSRAPAGEELFQWKLRQKTRFEEPTLALLAARCAQDLELPIRLLSGDLIPVPATEGTLSEVLEQALPTAGLYFRVRNGEVVIGTLKELLK